MAKRIISMNVDGKVYSDYLKLSKQLGLVMSRQVEMFMAEFVRKNRK